MPTEEPEAKQRLDQILLSRNDSLSRASVAKYIKRGHVTVNGTVETKPGLKLKPSEKISLIVPDNKDHNRESLDILIIYKDDDCIVINKPVGVLTHSKGSFNPEETVATWAQPYLSSMDGERAGIVHRLDRPTSGVMIIARNPSALKWLQKQFSQRRTKKIYTAVVHGIPANHEAIIDMPIERNPKHPQTFRTGINGKSALTAYTILKSNHKYSLVELKPTSGRTHQLRVHMAAIGHPIVGDSLYGTGLAERMFLHARSLEITLPDKHRKVFETPVPPEFLEIVS
ncbi:MAG TPA: RluA family pseudouridine synthase [Candidatus Saccharimonadales bacterium]|nr:RluA family pseudouridine synthase [Candidatus Saccharimonadales bacterium]